jgi:hypothetical protein
VHGTAEVCAEGVRPWLDAGASFVAGPLSRLPGPDGAFDVVLAFRLLSHVARWPELVRELCRVARHAVVVDYPTRRSVNVVSDSFFRMKKGVEGNTRPFRVFGEGEIEGAFAENGFTTSARRPQFLLPMALHRALGLVLVSKSLEGLAGLAGMRALLGSPVIRRWERRG